MPRDGGLLGQGHQSLVDDLLRHVRDAQAGVADVPRVVVLRGSSGVGKSRVLRELYGRLRELQPEPGYWPELPEVVRAGSGAADPMPNRKRLGPEAATFVWPAESLPSFAWWVLDCGRMPDGDAVDVVAQAAPELRTHLTAVSLAWREAAGVGDKLRASRSHVVARAREALAEGGLDSVSVVLTELGIPLPGLGLAVSWLTRGVSAGRRRTAEAQLLGSDVQLGKQVGETRAGVAQELGDLILEVAHPQLPAVVVVEDLHLMGPELARFLIHLGGPQPGRPVLIVGTAWPEGDANPDHAKWRAAAKLRRRTRIVDMPRLDPADLTVLLRRYAPGTDDANAERVVTRFGNPLALELLLTLGRVQRQIARADGSLELSTKELAELPHDIRGLYQATWDELPAGVRQSLMYAVGALPDAGPVPDPFLRSVVAVAAGTSGLLHTMSPADVAQGLERATQPHEWCVATEDLQRFREQVLADIAALSLRDQYDESDVAALRAATASQLSQWIDVRRGAGYWVDHTDPDVAAAARWLLALAPDGNAAAVAVAGVTSARLRADAHQYADAARVAAPAADLLRVLGADHPDTLTARSNLASLLGGRGGWTRRSSSSRRCWPTCCGCWARTTRTR